MFVFFRTLFASGRTARDVVRHARPQLESCEPRTLPAGVLLDAVTHELRIEGRQVGDVARVGSIGERVFVTFNGRVSAFSAQDIGQIRFNGYNGNDVFVNNTAIRSIADGGLGSDALYGGRGDDVLKGSYGSDLLAGNAGNDDLDGGAGNDLCGGGAGVDREEGGIGDDRLWGGDGRDLIAGSIGNDVLDGGLGDDRLRGGLGRDVLHGGGGTDSSDGESNELESGCEGQEIVAVLTGTTGRGKAEFSTGELEVEVAGLTANQTLDVKLDGTVIGSLSVGPFGLGKLELNGTSLTVAGGSTLEVVAADGTILLQGTFSVGDDGNDAGDDHGDDGPNHH